MLKLGTPHRLTSVLLVAAAVASLSAGPQRAAAHSDTPLKAPSTDGTVAVPADDASAPAGERSRPTDPATGSPPLDTSGRDSSTSPAVPGSGASAPTSEVADESSPAGVASGPSSSAALGTEYHGTVDAPLATAPAIITVTSPNGGENWAPGSTQTVTWIYDEPVPPATAIEPAPSAPAGDEQFDTVAAVAEAEGQVRAVVGLNVGFRPEGNIGPEQATAQRRGIDTARQRVVERLGGTRYGVARQFETVPSVVLELSAAAVERLRGAPEVASIAEDELAAPTLAESVPLVDTPPAWDAGFDGAGQVVAVLDTGVESGHPFLAGKVVEEACYSATGHCPNGATTQTGAGAGVPCTYASGCNHGTHVAGIAAGTGASFSGVGPGAALMAVQVFSRFDGEDVCGTGVTTCALSYASDQLAGLERVYLLRDVHAFASVNLSLGGGRFTSHCDSALQKPAIDNLRSVGIATVIASGNDGYTDAMNAPGCISTAVSVGSTTKTDTVSSFSNSASFLSLLAPGSGIRSSVTGGGFAFMSGTSMATPHVAGAWAVLKQYRPLASVDTILAALQSTGVPVTDSGNGIVTPRIRVEPALLALSARVDIHLLEGASVVATIAEDEPARPGAFDWTIPTDLGSGDDYRVRVTEVADPRATDTSDAPFTIFSRCAVVSVPSGPCRNTESGPDTVH